MTWIKVFPLSPEQQKSLHVWAINEGFGLTSKGFFTHKLSVGIALLYAGQLALVASAHAALWSSPLKTIERWSDDAGERIFGFESYCPKEKLPNLPEVPLIEKPGEVKQAWVNLGQCLGSNTATTLQLVPGLKAPIAVWREITKISFDGAARSDAELAAQAKPEWKWFVQAMAKRNQLMLVNFRGLGKMLVELSSGCPAGPVYGAEHACTVRALTRKNLKRFIVVEKQIEKLSQIYIGAPVCPPSVESCRKRLDAMREREKQELAKLRAEREVLLDQTPLIAHSNFSDYITAQNVDSFDSFADKNFAEDFETTVRKVQKSVQDRLDEGQETLRADSSNDAEAKDKFLHDSTILRELLATADSKIELKDPTLIEAACRIQNRTLKNSAMGQLRGLAVNSMLAIMPLGAGLMAKVVSGVSNASRVARLAPVIVGDAGGVALDVATMKSLAERCDRLQSGMLLKDRDPESKEVAAAAYRECERELSSQVTMALAGGAGAALSTKMALKADAGAALDAKRQMAAAEQAQREVDAVKKIEAAKEVDGVVPAVAAARVASSPAVKSSGILLTPSVSKQFDAVLASAVFKKSASRTVLKPALQQDYDDVMMMLAQASEGSRKQFLKKAGKLRPDELDSVIKKMARNKGCVVPR